MKENFLIKNVELMKEWDFNKNHINPNTISHKYYKKVWWLGKCGHEWEATIDKRSNGRGCPKCHHKILEN